MWFWGKEQGDERNTKVLINSPQFESFQIREQVFVNGAKLDDRKNFQRRELLKVAISELSYPSSIFRRRRESFKGLSNWIVKGTKKTHIVGALTLYPPSSQTSLGSDLSNGHSDSCFAHNASSTGSSKPLQQHARQAAVAFPPNATSSRAMSLTILVYVETGVHWV